jgi:hypothetical protein
MVIRKASAGALVLAVLVMLALGCTRNSPVQPASVDPTAFSGVEALTLVQFTALVQTRDEAQRMLTFLEKPDTVVANQNCEITRLQNGQEDSVSFGDIHAGDSVQVFGDKNQNGYVYAYKLRIRWQNSDSCQFAARIATMDQTRMMLTFRDRGDTVFADQNCVCVRQCNRLEIRVQFSQLQPGDSVRVSGIRGSDGYIDARQIHICMSDPTGRWDIAFRDTVATIDYTAGTLTVAGRSELILVDSNTIIRGILVRITPGAEGRGNIDATLAGPNSRGKSFVDTMLTITDLQIGDIVLIHAVFLDSATLLAKCITLVDIVQFEKKQCVEFTDVLASIDVASRIVTFEGVSWIGLVCNGALLTGLDGEPLVLDDFSAGDMVAVKGFPMEGDTLKVSQMAKM